MKPARLALLALASCLPLLASAQWIWVDKDGHKVFSDRAPPSEIAPDHVLRHPGSHGMSAEPEAAAPTAAPATATTAANVPKPSGRDPVLEEKRKQAEAAQAQKLRAQEEQVAAARADNCKRAREGKADLESGARIVRTDEKGERQYMDDDQRAQELHRLGGIIARDCAH